jgi:hypothetical protein
MNTKCSEYFANKRIVLVGPSPSLLNRQDGKLIDSYDIVCRIKKSYPIPPKLINNLGNRTDILMSHLKLKGRGYSQNNFEQHNVAVFNSLKFIIFPFPIYEQFERFYTTYKKKCKNIQTPVVYQENVNNLNMIKKELNGFTSTTGIASIVHLLDYDIKELYITGMTFQIDGFTDYYKTKKEEETRFKATSHVHNMNNELIFFKKLYQKDKRIKLDPVLKDIIDKLDSEESLVPNNNQ